jgi:hypothetical protein
VVALSQALIFAALKIVFANTSIPEMALATRLCDQLIFEIHCPEGLFESQPTCGHVDILFHIISHCRHMLEWYLVLGHCYFLSG